MAKANKGLTRRRFLEGVGLAGGSAALYETMTALGLINLPEAWAGPPQLPRAGAGKKVVILGAGIAGLMAAYELNLAGYQCQIIELTDRAGGRNHTARKGTVLVERDTNGNKTEQICKFDEGLYLNLGPGRIPYHHRRVLHYCKEFNVALEVYVMETMANLFQRDSAFGGQATVRRRIYNDIQGYISEWLAKAVDQKALDEVLNTEEDRSRLLCLLRTFGDLGQNDKCSECNKTKCKNCNASSCSACALCFKECPTCARYSGSTRDGCEITVVEPCTPGPKLPWQDLLSSEFWRYRFYQSFEYEWQPTLFQPVGGMDKIVDAFVRRVGKFIKYSTTVVDIRTGKDGVSVVVDDIMGRRSTITADYCISNIPLPLLKNIPNNFSADFLAAVETCVWDPTCKLGWQANERFWEDNKNQIYGGISYTDDTITQMWYPSYDYFTKNGTLTGVYNYDADAVAFGKLSPAARIERARQGAIKLHPEFRSQGVVPSDKAISIAWQNIPNEGGGWANWDPNSQKHADAYGRLLAPDGRFFVTGDQVSQLPGWQEGAMMSAQYVMEQITGLKSLTVPRILRAPNTRRLIHGRS